MEAEAFIHTSSIFTDQPREVALKRWEVSHPGCVIRRVETWGGAIRIHYQKTVEIEAAKQANAKRPVKDRRTLEEYLRDEDRKKSRGSRGINLY